MKKHELTWVAGLLEGEGSFTEKHTKSGTRHYYYANVQCNMTDEDVIRKLHAITAVGNVSGPHFHGKHKPSWTWRVGAQADVMPLLAALLPYMGERRSAKIQALLNAYNVVK